MVKAKPRPTDNTGNCAIELDSLNPASALLSRCMCCNIFLFSRVLYLTSREADGRREEADNETAPAPIIIALPGDRAARLARLKYLARPTDPV